MKKAIIFIFVILFVGFVFAARGFSLYHIEITPEYPKSGQEIKATLQGPGASYLQEIVWALDEDIIQESYGKTSIKLKLEEPVTLRVFFKEDGQIKQLEKKITPLNVTLIKESSGYFEGVRFPVRGAPLKIVAVTKQPASELFFSWKIDGEEALSGFGKNVLTINEPENGQVVLLELQDKAKTPIFKTGTRVKLKNPEVLVHNQNDRFIDKEVFLQNTEFLYAKLNPTHSYKDLQCVFEAEEIKSSNVLLITPELKNKDSIKVTCSDDVFSASKVIKIKK